MNKHDKRSSISNNNNGNSNARTYAEMARGITNNLQQNEQCNVSAFTEIFNFIKEFNVASKIMSLINKISNLKNSDTMTKIMMIIEIVLTHFID